MTYLSQPKLSFKEFTCGGLLLKWFSTLENFLHCLNKYIFTTLIKIISLVYYSNRISTEDCFPSLYKNHEMLMILR
ncbi:hypothetical protein SAMN05421800_11638 [Chryseobacterium balustinum]|uniref:Uncharacterized protein n=1 Tax=Chryseobacterium balustinum TaxID=246 RepID=A0AAX2ILU3_9FLAO|nr:hypothetical protein SAMN05421800_11638 [Chryseobacterium balustinum]SQA90183.1 Uncharacterised protein [Chryseobacterium balustinum]